jgi:hypothetical protein
VRQVRHTSNSHDRGENRRAQKLPGYFNLYWDGKQGKLWLKIDKWSSEFLYQSGLPAGIGSNAIGLDRGQLGATRMVRFEPSGPKVLLIQENLDYRAVSNDPDERRGAQLFRGVRAVGFQGGCGGKGSCPGGRHAAEHSRQRVRTSSSRLGSGTNLAFSERSEADERHASG